MICNDCPYLKVIDPMNGECNIRHSQVLQKMDYPPHGGVLEPEPFADAAGHFVPRYESSCSFYDEFQRVNGLRL
jgi:hypothetical protein